MRAWFDIDGVLYNTHEHIRDFVDTYYPKDLWVWNDYDIRKCDVPKHIQRLVRSLYGSGSELMFEMPPVPGAPELLNRLSKRHEVAILTGRSEKDAWRTSQMIRRDFGDYPIHFSRDKARDLCELEVDVYFEDCLAIVNSILAYPSDTLPILIAQPYNESTYKRYSIKPEGRLKCQSTGIAVSVEQS